MATWRMAMNGVVGIVTGALPETTPAVPAAIGWPSRGAIEAVAAQSAGAPIAIISVYDRNEARDVTRWNRIEVGCTPTAPGVAVEPVGGTMVPGAQLVFGLSGTPIVNDAVGISAANGRLSGGVTASVTTAGKTAQQLTVSLAQAINDDPVLSVLMVASTSSANLILTNTCQRPVTVGLGAGNISNLTTEVSRKERRIQVTVWAATEAALEMICDPLEAAFGNLQSSFGVQLADSTWMRVKLAGDVHRLEGIKEDTYRRDFFVSAEYGVTIQNAAYTVLVAIETLDAGYLQTT